MNQDQNDEKEAKRTFWQGIIGQISDLAVSCIEPVLKTISTIGIITAATFGLIFTNIPYLPFAIVAASAIAIIGLWRSGNRTLFKENHKDIKRLKAEIELLRGELAGYDERIGNIELLESFEERLARQELEKRDMLSSNSSLRKAERSEEPATMPSSMETE